MPIAVVTGASSPIGQAIAKLFVDRGYEVISHRRSQFDLSTQSGQEAFCDDLCSQISSVDVLVHNAASYEKSTLSTLTREQWRKTMALNVEAPLFVTQRLLPLLNAAPAPSVIMLTDAMTERVRPSHLAYGLSKAQLTHATLALAVDLAPRVRVNAVAPGIVEHSPDFTDDRKSAMIEKIPLRRPAQSEDIAKAVLFLACDAPYATGEIVVVDGGRRLV